MLPKFAFLMQYLVDQEVNFTSEEILRPMQLLRVGICSFTIHAII